MDPCGRIYDTLRNSGQQDLLLNWMLGVEKNTGLKGDSSS